MNRPNRRNRRRENLPARRNRSDLPRGYLGRLETWQAPLPPPQALGQYEEVLLGAADRILTQSENEQTHRHNQERTALETARMVVVADSRRSYIGIIFGFVISLLGIGGSIYLIATGHDWAGATLGGINLTGLAGVFVYGARRAGRRRNAEPEVETPEPSR